MIYVKGESFSFIFCLSALNACRFMVSFFICGKASYCFFAMVILPGPYFTMV